MSEGRRSEEVGELRLAAESIEALASRLAELLAPQRPPERRSPPPRLLSAAEVARWWGVRRSWVYNHAEQLGARRLGSGERPRLRFDPDEVAERLGAPARPRSGGRDARRSPSIRPDSLSVRTRAIVAEQGKKRPGRRPNAPRPGAEGGASAR